MAARDPQVQQYPTRMQEYNAEWARLRHLIQSDPREAERVVFEEYSTPTRGLMVNTDLRGWAQTVDARRRLEAILAEQRSHAAAHDYYLGLSPQLQQVLAGAQAEYERWLVRDDGSEGVPMWNSLAQPLRIELYQRSREVQLWLAGQWMYELGGDLLLTLRAEIPDLPGGSGGAMEDEEQYGESWYAKYEPEDGEDADMTGGPA